MGVFVRALSGFELGAGNIVALRASMTAAILLVVAAARYPAALRVRVCDLWCFAGTGILSVVFFNYCYFRTITLTSLSVAAVLLYTAPAFVMLLSLYLFREPATQSKRIALALAFAGCVLVSGPMSTVRTDPLNLAGVLTGLGAGFGYALYSIFSRYALERGYGPLTIAVYTFVFASVALTVAVDYHSLGRALVLQPVLAYWAVAMAVCTTVLPYLLYTGGLRTIGPSRASIIASVEPVGATLLGTLYYGEALTVRGAVGVTLVIASIILLSRTYRGE